MDLSTLKFNKNDREQFVKDCFEILKYVEPYSDEEIDKLYFNDGVDIEKILATKAKEYLIENGYLEKK